MDANIQAQFDAMTATIQQLQAQIAAAPPPVQAAVPAIPPTNGPGQQGGIISYDATGIKIWKGASAPLGYLFDG